jgi:hypothetical protein
MGDNSQEFKLLITGDASSAVDATKQAGDATRKLKVDTSDLSDETKKSLNLLPQATDEVKKSAEASNEAGISHREQREALRELTRGYPELGAAARSVLNPITLAAFGIAEAFTIWSEKIKTAQELLGGWELPDFTIHATGVSAAAEAYDRLKTAVAGADAEFDSAASIFERQAKAIQAQLTATKSLIEAQKQKAMADLDLQRASGQVTPAAYDARKSIIEQGYNDKTTQAEIDARNADLAAKKQEAAQMGQDAAAKAAKAAGIQPGLNDEGMEELINKAKAAVEAAKTQAEKFRAEEKKAKELQEIKDEPAGLQKVKDIAFAGVDTLEMEKKYGAVGFDKIAQLNADAAKKAEETQAIAETQEKQLEKQRADRNKLNEESAREAADAEKKRRELQGEDDPKKGGSVAWQNTQAAAAQQTRDDTGLENSFTKDVENFNKDADELKRTIGRTDPASIVKARQSMADMSAAVQDAMDIMQTLAADHQNVSALAAEVALMKRQIQQVGFTTR